MDYMDILELLGDQDILVMLDNGHGIPVLAGGKCSPDRRILEPKWAREMVRRLEVELRNRGIKTMRVCPEETDVTPPERVKRINEVCRKRGAKKCVLVSIHINATGTDNQWHEPHGWSVFVSKNSSDASKRLARIMTEKAEAIGLTKGRYVPDRKYWQWDWTGKDIYILKKSACPAVLTENMFMDNREDATYLCSERGKETLTQLHADAIEEYIHQM